MSTGSTASPWRHHGSGAGIEQAPAGRLWLLIPFAGGLVVGSFFPWFHRRPKATPSPLVSTSS